MKSFWQISSTQFEAELDFSIEMRHQIIDNHCRNVAGLSLFYRYYFGRCSSELAVLVPVPYSRRRSTRYPDRLHDFSVTIPRCYKYVYVNSFFLCPARSRNSLPIECFPLTYDINGLKSRIIRHLLTVGSFWADFMYALIFLFLFLVTSCLVMAVQPCMEWIPIKKMKHLLFKTKMFLLLSIKTPISHQKTDLIRQKLFSFFKQCFKNK